MSEYAFLLPFQDEIPSQSNRLSDKSIEEKVVEANVPNTLIVLVTSPADANLTDVELYFTDTYANSNVILEQAESASFNIANISTP